MKIYIATSWKCEEWAKLIAQLLRVDGHEVDCFCDASTGRYCFKWTDHFSDIKEANVFSFLALPEARKAFEEDKKWIDWSDAVVMLYPCGNSAHLEAGYAKGSGKYFFIYGQFPDGYFENMYGFADGIFGPDQLDELRCVLKITPAADPVPE
jgi:hypothetical protein